MKKLSDHKGEEAILLWADISNEIVQIVGDGKIANLIRQKKPKLIIANEILKAYPKETCRILERIDPTPIDGFNTLKRLLSLLEEISEDEDVKVFLASLAEKEEGNASGSATENTEESENPDTFSDT